MTESEQTGREPRLSPALIATLVAIPVMVVAGFIAFAVLRSDRASTVPIESYSTSSENADLCGPLIAKLPESFDDYRHKKVDGNTVTWTSNKSGDSGDPLMLRCGVARPKDLAPTSALQVINAVQWFMTDSDTSRGQAFVVVDRRPYVAVWVPVGSGNGALTDISGLVAGLPEAPLDFGH
ncbi:DUF3515 domain-containing protein [Gordonia sp. FQ]|uniref:DUF3515 domain-containing protein n=1 Tax=Gordonia sp. FQ TaxID=3446634 RepID=UPI003F842ED1